jgi:hypothetical protein
MQAVEQRMAGQFSGLPRYAQAVILQLGFEVRQVEAVEQPLPAGLYFRHQFQRLLAPVAAAVPLVEVGIACMQRQVAGETPAVLRQRSILFVSTVRC